MTKEEILMALHRIGFSGFEHLDKQKRDGKKRMTWAVPLQNYNEWFTVLILVEDSQVLIEKINNPLAKTFEGNDMSGLIQYIDTVIIRIISPDAEC